MRMQSPIFMLVFILAVLVMCVALPMILNYNGLVKAEKAVDEAWAQIDTALERRLELIPSLVNIVKGYAEHERGTLLAVIEARNSAQNVLEVSKAKESLNQEDVANLMSSQARVTSSLKDLFALVESYPDLKAAMNFLALQDQMEGTINRIATSRNRYNTAIRIYNSKRETFPGVIIAPVFGFEEKYPFEAREKAREDYVVEF